jgi:flavin reductase (DIM6/NTAB) family NADH-FMN oxidoreductase RutF
MKLTTSVFRPVVPTPAALITSASADGRPNVLTLGEVYILSLDPLVFGIGIRPSRYSHRLISETGEYVANFPTADLIARVDLCGMSSGLETDKFAAFGLTATPGSVVKAPLIAECPLNVECRVRDVLPMGSHDCFVGEVVATHVEDWALDDEGQFDPVKARSIALVGRSYWAIGPKLDRAFVRNRTVTR